MRVLSEISNKFVKRLGAVLVCLKIHKGGLNRQSHTLLKISPNPWLLEYLP